MRRKIKMTSLRYIVSGVIIGGILGYSIPMPNTVDSFRNSIERTVRKAADDTNTILVGEDHNEEQCDYIFREHILPPLAKEGYNHLVMELDTSLQPLANRLPESTPEIREAIDRYLGTYDLIEVIVKADELGYQVHFVDNIDLGFKGPEHLTERNKGIADVVQSRIFDQDPDAKIVGYFGASHVPTEPFFRKDAGTIEPVGYFLDQARDDEPFVLVMTPEYKLDIDFDPTFHPDTEGQTMSIFPLTMKYKHAVWALEDEKK
jgi:hypothetical protein